MTITKYLCNEAGRMAPLIDALTPENRGDYALLAQAVMLFRTIAALPEAVQPNDGTIEKLKAQIAARDAALQEAAWDLRLWMSTYYSNNPITTPLVARIEAILKEKPNG